MDKQLSLYKIEINHRCEKVLRLTDKRLPPIVVKWIDNVVSSKHRKLTIYDDLLFADKVLFNKYFPNVHLSSEPFPPQYKRLYEQLVNARNIDHKDIIEGYTKRGVRIMFKHIRPKHIPQHIDDLLYLDNPCCVIHELFMRGRDIDIDILKMPTRFEQPPSVYMPRILEGCKQICDNADEFELFSFKLPYCYPWNHTEVRNGGFMMLIVKTLLAFDCDVLHEYVTEEFMSRIVDLLVQRGSDRLHVIRYAPDFEEDEHGEYKDSMLDLYDVPSLLHMLYYALRDCRESIRFLNDMFIRIWKKRGIQNDRVLRLRMIPKA